MSGRVVLAMSGGVDSSAAAYLLKEQGYEVIGLFMRSGATEDVCALPEENPLQIIDPKSHKQGCCSAEDAADARRIADQLDIPFHALNFKDAFGRIKDYFAEEYLSGRTPNPCVQCNNWLKFGKIWDFAKQVRADKIATGHYAQIQIDAEGKHGLHRGLDGNKDQSYVLFGINPGLLENIIFPVGNNTKDEIREMSRSAGLTRVSEKRDSQEICFIPDNDYAAFIDRYCDERPETAGDLVDTGGNVLGTHDGFQRFTVGQRKGLGITFGEPRYVISIQPDTKRVVIGTKEDLAQSDLQADQLNWMVPTTETRFTCMAKIRYRHTAATAEVELVGDDLVNVRFQEPQYGVAPGQAVVFYDDDRVLGGGWIR